MTSYPIAAVKVSHDVLELLADRGEAGVTEVATALSLPKSTAHDHLRTLERVGSAVNEGGRYRLSMQFLHFGKVARNNTELFVRGRDEALGLSAAVGEQKYVQLVTEENGRCAVVLAARWQRETLPPQATQIYPTHVPLHTNAPGKAILASMNPQEVERILAEQGLERLTPATMTDEDELLLELERIREQGYATDDGELIAGMAGVAAPVVTDADVHGAIAVYSASEGFEADDGDSAVADMVRDAADEIQANIIFAHDR
jgi:DNA-binding IclR family transcriptional regulator